ncbi:DUF6453 family protein [Enterobacteriaceae bacterium H20N1]|uniref:DUF6453 family protein n=1 Tax=Dryocola boscaweniae TaxID=2925397 RepID=A0A9X2W8H4_9ENTR|nr:DUF6453 family protein [Dryocola boscaweniae]MCT4701234.1 DUF6453 family protein [Dryocola boscaweniae]MCT4718261.1 DUF6453 family protein [Dryocola boscaweniae]
MAQGLYVLPDDGGPAIELTAASIRAPSWLQHYEPTAGTGGTTITVPGMYAGATMFMVPTQTCSVLFDGTSVIPTVTVAGTLSQSGNRLVLSDGKDVLRGEIFQIIPASVSGYGLYLQDATDFLAINDATVLGQCLFKARITVAPNWTVPQIGSIPKSRYLVFANWNSSGVVLDFDGEIIRAYADQNGNNSQSGISLTVDVIIFVNGGTIEPTPLGLNIFNAAGQCTFSTRRTPLLLRGFLTPTASFKSPATGVARMAIPLGRVGMMGSESSGTQYIKYAGLVMTNNQVRAGKGVVAGSFSNQYGRPDDRLISIPLPVIDAANYIV